MALLLARPLAEQYRHGLAASRLAYSSDDSERNRLDTAGAQIRNLAAGKRPIYVWAYDPGIYLYADRRPASRFTYPRSAEQIDQILSDLAAGEADLLLIPQGGSARFDRWCDDACRQRLDDILTDYDTSMTIGRYAVWRPK